MQQRKAVFMDAALHAKLKKRAQKNHRSMVGELQALLADN